MPDDASQNAGLGAQLRAAREKKGVTPSQAAAATRMKVQVLEALEREDFSRLIAPAYARGFIKLYAEYLGLEAAPLLALYAGLTDALAPPRLKKNPLMEPPAAVTPLPTSAIKPEPGAQAATPAPAPGLDFWPRYRPYFFAALVLAFLCSILIMLFRPGLGAEKAKDLVPSHEIIQEPPEPYLE